MENTNLLLSGEQLRKYLKKKMIVLNKNIKGRWEEEYKFQVKSKDMVRVRAALFAGAELGFVRKGNVPPCENF